MLNISILQQRHEARLSKLRDVIDKVLPVDVKNRGDAVDELARIVSELEYYLLVDKSPSEDKGTTHKLLQKSAKDMAVLANHLEKIDELLEQSAPATQITIAQELEKRGISPDILSNAMTILHEIAVNHSKPPPPLQQGNTKTAIGLYTATVYRHLNTVGICKMRAASRIVASLLISTIPQYHEHDPDKLADSCYQLIRESVSR
ncbi:hypothetical protein Tel_13015 [Candidatus Tenderia electrophaga]|uniref:Uncharacterized protein n=1 Tax=Candidatus Tenderia electrophaga TaxID=1748243 RepID=A0A0S2TFY1_9GAMM|nr:hypothetical protein Tel_13015 [Candidatus Tenderia electrophaga]